MYDSNESQYQWRKRGHIVFTSYEITSDKLPVRRRHRPSPCRRPTNLAGGMQRCKVQRQAQNHSTAPPGYFVDENEPLFGEAARPRKITRKSNSGSSRGRSARPLSGCDALCWAVEQLYKASFEGLKTGGYSSDILWTLTEEWNKKRNEMRSNNDGHCLPMFSDKLEFCRDMVSDGLGELALLPTCKRFLHMATAYEDDAISCLKGKHPI